MRDSSRKRSYVWPLMFGLSVVILGWLTAGLFWPRASASEQRMRVDAARTPAAGRERALTPQPVAADVRVQQVETAAVTAQLDAVKLPPLERDPAEARLLWEAGQRLVASCMRERGFTYAPPPYANSDAEARAFEQVSPGDVEAARALGYGLVHDIERAAQPEPEPAESPAVAALAPDQRRAYIEALIGPEVPAQERTEERGFATLTVPGRGTLSWFKAACYPMADQRLYGPHIEHNEVGPTRVKLAERVAELRDHDPAYRARLEVWRDCMRAEGVSEPLTPGAAADGLRLRYLQHELDLNALAALERKLATADATCYQRVGIEPVRVEATQRAQERVAQEQAPLVERFAQERREALQRATEIMSGAEHSP